MSIRISLKELSENEKAFICDNYTYKSESNGRAINNNWISKKLNVKHSVVIKYAAYLKTLKSTIEISKYTFKAPLVYCELHGCALTGDSCLQCLVDGI